MKNSHLIGAVCTAIFSFITLPSQAALIPVLDGQAYYDDVADLTWLANANAAVGSVYDTYIPGSGRMIWHTAKAWAAGLDVDGVTGWRLPTSLNADGSGPCSADNCTGSEMGNMFYNVLGGVAGSSITTTHNSNYDLFSNIQPQSYWSSTESDPAYWAWLFDFGGGSQYDFNKGVIAYAWAVHEGNVVVPPIDNGYTTIDTTSGLEWLDLTLTQGVSAQDVLNGFGGYVDAGWTFATAE